MRGNTVGGAIASLGESMRFPAHPPVTQVEVLLPPARPPSLIDDGREIVLNRVLTTSVARESHSSEKCLIDKREPADHSCNRVSLSL